MTLRPIIEIKGLNTQFGKQVVHKNLNLTIYEIMNSEQMLKKHTKESYCLLDIKKSENFKF